MADPNRALFESVVELLDPVLDQLVFVGGCTTGIFVTDPAAGGIRPTRDVDAIVDVTTYAEYAALAERLRTLGLTEDTSEDAPLCRWRRDQVVLDVMPVNEKILGFGNRWYPAAVETARTHHVAGRNVHIVTPSHFVATKLEAFRGRGKNDISSSHDLEDIIMVVDGRPELPEEIGAANVDVRGYIAAAIRALLDDQDFMDALPGFLFPDAGSQARRSLIERRLRVISEL